ncbi:MAG TPA: MOSC N-terminal beta barrel domain-containing protein [Rugosimonospora sp.]|nr:MOSC N-terminal beta barrel domain-containing protein [Rugosimonospora sp.]
MRLASIHTYPVKGCHRVDQERATVEPWGLAGDRRWMPVDAAGKMVSQREVPRLTQVQPSTVDGYLILAAPGMPELKVPAVAGDLVEVAIWRNRVPASPAGAEADAWLSAVAGGPLRLVYLDDPTRRPVDPAYGRPGDRVSFADGYPLLVTNTASLDALNDWIVEAGNEPVPMTRFRPNIVVTGAAAWAEDGWLGRRIRVGAVTFRAPKPCDRCVMTTNDQETGERGREPLRTLGRYRNINQQLLFGVNLVPDAPGEIATGDEIEILSA